MKTLVYRVMNRWRRCEIEKAKFVRARSYESQPVHFGFDGSLNLGRLKTRHVGDAVHVPDLEEEFKYGKCSAVRVLREDIADEVAAMDAEIERLHQQIASIKTRQQKLLEHGFYSSKPLAREQLLERGVVVGG